MVKTLTTKSKCLTRAGMRMWDFLTTNDRYLPSDYAELIGIYFRCGNRTKILLILQIGNFENDLYVFMYMSIKNIGKRMPINADKSKMPVYIWL
jgi:hypothetical protein